MPITTSHCSCPFLTRSRSGAGIRQRVHSPRFSARFDLLLGAVEDEDRLGTPEHLDDLAFGDRRQVDLDRGAGGDRRGVRVHLGDQRHQCRRGADGADGCRLRCKGNRGGVGSAEVAVTRLSLLVGRSTHPRGEPQMSRAKRGGGRAGRAGPGEGRKARSGGVYWHPCGGAQARYRGNDRESPQILCYHGFRGIDAGSTPSANQSPCGSRFTSRTSRRTPARFCGSCACLGVEAHIIEPAGFPISDRAFRRAGMDYLDQVALMRHGSWPAFEAWRRAQRLRLILFTTTADVSYLDHAYRRRRRPAVRPRDRRRARGGAPGRRRAAAHPDAAGLALDQCGDGRGHGAGEAMRQTAGSSGAGP